MNDWGKLGNHTMTITLWNETNQNGEILDEVVVTFQVVNVKDLQVSDELE